MIRCCFGSLLVNLAWLKPVVERSGPCSLEVILREWMEKGEEMLIWGRINKACK